MWGAKHEERRSLPHGTKNIFAEEKEKERGIL